MSREDERLRLHLLQTSAVAHLRPCYPRSTGRNRRWPRCQHCRSSVCLTDRLSRLRYQVCDRGLGNGRKTLARILRLRRTADDTTYQAPSKTLHFLGVSLGEDYFPRRSGGRQSMLRKIAVASLRWRSRQGQICRLQGYRFRLLVSDVRR